MFDLVVKDRRLNIVAIDIHIDSSSSETFEMYVRNGSFEKVSRHPGAWTHHMTSDIVGTGYGVPLNIQLSESLVLDAGMTKAFYLTLQSARMIYSIGTSIGNVFIENNHLMILEGVGKLYLFRNNFADRVFNGAIYYSVLSEDYHDVHHVNVENDMDEYVEGKSSPFPTASPSTSLNFKKQEHNAKR